MSDHTETYGLRPGAPWRGRELSDTRTECSPHTEPVRSGPTQAKASTAEGRRGRGPACTMHLTVPTGASSQKVKRRHLGKHKFTLTAQEGTQVPTAALPDTQLGRPPVCGLTSRPRPSMQFHPGSANPTTGRHHCTPSSTDNTETTAGNECGNREGKWELLPAGQNVGRRSGRGWLLHVPRPTASNPPPAYCPKALVRKHSLQLHS